MLIGGAWVGSESGETFRCVDPYTELAWGRVPVAGSAEVNRAVDAARRAFDTGGWPQTTASVRAALLHRLADLIDEHADALAQRQVRENGKLLTEMRAGATVFSGDCRFFAGLAETLTGATVPLSATRTSSATRCVSRSASLPRSRPGTRRSTCSAGSSSQRWQPETRSS